MKKKPKKCSCGMSGKTLTDHKMGCEVMAKKIKKMFNTPVSVSLRGICNLLPLKKRKPKKGK